MALTVGVATILDAREVVTIVTGAHKALALKRAVEDGVSHMCTLSALQMHAHALVVADEDATLEMQVKTVRYFRSIETVAAEAGFGQVLPSQEKVRRKRDSVLEEIANSPRSPRSPGSPRSPEVLKGAEGLLPPPARVERSVTPELVPDCMASRMPVRIERALSGDIPIQAMHARMV